MFKNAKYIVIPFLLKIIIVTITATCKLRWLGRERIESLTSSKDMGCIISSWHECSTIGTWVLRNRNIVGMVSDSRDGNYISRFAEQFGNETVRGSTSSGSSRVTREILKKLKQKKAIAITPDGPRGPKNKVQNGVLWLSALGKVPIIPFHVEASKQWVFKSWDDHKIPKPFSTIYISAGETCLISREDLNDDSIKSTTEEFEKLMMQNVRTVRRQIQRDSVTNA